MSCRRKWTTNNLQRKLEVALKGEKSLHSIQRHFTYYVKIRLKESHFSVELQSLRLFFALEKTSQNEVLLEFKQSLTNFSIIFFPM